nr:ATP synthase F0 subunit 8 [Dendroctonus valens]
MPQMAPLSWLSMYLYFSILFMMMAIIGYFNFSYLAKKNSITPTINKINWKW